MEFIFNEVDFETYECRWIFISEKNSKEWTNHVD